MLEETSHIYEKEYQAYGTYFDVELPDSPITEYTLYGDLNNDGLLTNDDYNKLILGDLEIWGLVNFVLFNNRKMKTHNS